MCVQHRSKMFNSVTINMTSQRELHLSVVLNTCLHVSYCYKGYQATQVTKIYPRVWWGLTGFYSSALIYHACFQ